MADLRNPRSVKFDDPVGHPIVQQLPIHLFINTSFNYLRNEVVSRSAAPSCSSFGNRTFSNYAISSDIGGLKNS